ncbi:XisI protein [Anabaena subtropica FACHB-260]|uniref:XisI protein n=1 Tax=Anabaena subtropica FACHB-260 TaxID=2692884 RepID=A0ABR8CKS1_9NOST|nr:XisI protein [Anabaena subtropica FACHB-260]
MIVKLTVGCVIAQRNAPSIANQLVELGVPKTDIVLGFKSP